MMGLNGRRLVGWGCSLLVWFLLIESSIVSGASATEADPLNTEAAAPGSGDMTWFNRLFNEAETEIAGGVLIEYSGALLALWKLAQAVMLVAFPLFLVVLFMGGIGNGFVPILKGIAKYVLVLVLLILIKNTNPRMRIDQAVKFFWFYCGPVMAVAIVLAMLGNYYDKWWL